MLNQKLQLKLSQKLSPQQIQLMKLIQLTTAELEQKIKNEIEENPALEMGNEKTEVENDEFEISQNDDVDVDGDSNTLNFTGSGYAGGYFYLDQTGNSRTFNITQSSTLDNDWLKIISIGNSGTVCVIQNDQGTSTSC